ncbi:MAG: hypothetical protein KKD94_00660 [Nanoarchaeota archaeon]|nr:hypothetical protein [Nanoarchaeota archaeon]
MAWWASVLRETWGGLIHCERGRELGIRTAIKKIFNKATTSALSGVLKLKPKNNYSKKI